MQQFLTIHKCLPAAGCGTNWAVVGGGVRGVDRQSAAGPVLLAPDGGPRFCAVEQPRRFSAAELDARRAYVENLRRDLETNERGADHCGGAVCGADQQQCSVNAICKGISVRMMAWRTRPQSASSMLPIKPRKISKNQSPFIADVCGVRRVKFVWAAEPQCRE